MRLLILLSFMALSACGQTKRSTNSKGLPLASQWIIHYFVEGNKSIYPENKSAFITIEAGLKKFSGKGGCNSLGGALQTKGKNIHFSDMYITEMLCDDMSTENKFVMALNKANQYEIKGGELYLKKDGTTLMVLESFR